MWMKLWCFCGVCVLSSPAQGAHGPSAHQVYIPASDLRYAAEQRAGCRAHQSTVQEQHRALTRQGCAVCCFFLSFLKAKPAFMSHYETGKP